MESDNKIFDFGFTVVHEHELESSQSAAHNILLAESNQNKLDKLYKAIIPLLTNLKKNPEKDYIFWPDRIIKIEEFEKMITDIYH